MAGEGYLRITHISLRGKMSLGFTFNLPGYFPGFFHQPLIRTVETGFISTNVYPTFYKHTVIEFTVPQQWGACSFDVYRGPTDVGPWSKISDAPTTDNYFKDVTTKNFSKVSEAWYVVECLLPDGRRIQSTPCTWEVTRNDWVELRAKEIERREILLLEKFVGTQSLVFRRRRSGARCPECWDFQTEKVTKDHCKTCLGTGFKGGYYSGMETLMQYEPGNDTLAFQDIGRAESSVTNAWTISTPRIDPLDLIIKVPEFSLYRVENVQSTKLQSKVVRQLVTLVELDKDSIEFQLAKVVIPQAYQ